MRIIFFFIFFVRASIAFAQCPTPDFSVKPAVCLDERVLLENTTVDADSFQWDFCVGDLAGAPAGNIVANSSLLSNVRSLRIVKEGTEYFGFGISSNATGNLVRLYFGENIESTPTVNLAANNLGITNSFGFDIVKVDGVWVAFVVNGSATVKNVMRLTFSNGLANLPQVAILQTGSTFETNAPNFIRIVQNNGSIHGFVTSSPNRVVRLDFGASVFNLSPSIAEFTVPGIAEIRGLAFSNTCGIWTALAVGGASSSVYRLSFGNNLLSLPSTTALTVTPALSQPVNIEIRKDAEIDYAFIQNRRSNTAASFHRLTFESGIGGAITASEEFKPAEISNEASSNYALEMVYHESKWDYFTVNLTAQSLVRIRFPNLCEVSPTPISNAISPLVSYTTPGAFKISLIATNSQGSTEIVKPISISSSSAPTITFASQNVCEDAPVNFTSSASLPIVNYNWNFGDGNTSTDPNPSNTFLNDGEYNVRLIVTADNACQNLTEQTISIFNQPIAGFDFLSLSQYCTNQQYDFQNISTIDPDYPVTWQWQINNVSVSTDEDLFYTFTSTTSQEVKLIASIPGCSSETSQTISSLDEGPITDFNFSGQCQDSVVQFTNLSSGSITSFDWNFADGQSSTQTNPESIFANTGTFDVILTAFGTSGCNNTQTKTVTIYSKPQVNFNADLPPFSCSGLPTQFRDLTPNPFDSNITQWSWDFDDDNNNTASQKNPLHTYAVAGSYDVSLTVTTNFGCQATLQKPIIISPSPQASFTYTAPCRDVPVQFTNTTPGSLASQQWQIGTSNYATPNPIHTFTNSTNYTVNLAVTASNGCIGFIEEIVTVPNVLMPNFNFTRNCIDQETLFTDITNDAEDEIENWQWNFAGLGTGLGSPETFTFANTGNYNVGMTVTTATGCVYSTVKQVPIVAAPRADFSASPQFGVPPLAVQFLNTSTNATTYLWSFNDPLNTTSTATSPSFTFQELGEYQVQLSAFNAQQCVNTISKTIQAVVPQLDVTLSQLELDPTSNGGAKPSVTIHNKSNVTLTSVPLLLSISGSEIREYVEAIIPPNTSYTHTVNFEFPQAQGYFCATIEIDDGTPADNRQCSTFEPTAILFNPYPNPAIENITVSWIVNNTMPVRIELIHSSGKSIKSLELLATSGYNVIDIPLTDIASGLYIVRVSMTGANTAFKVFVTD